MRSTLVRITGQFSGRLAGMTGMAMVMVLAATPVHAQDSAAKRLDKVESEVRALQRKVFPGPDGKYFAPEITPGTPTPAATPVPTSTPVTDLLTRMDSLEAQMARLTSQVEQNTNRLNQIEAKLASGAPAEAAPAAAAPAPASTTAPAPAPTAAPATKPEPAAAKPPAAPPASRVAAVQAVVKPQTDDPGDDEYSYGYRLWDAKFYPEAQQQLKLFLEKYPRHRRASWARNLLGRAYLDEGNAGEAAKWFLQNYQTDKSGERAPDSLLYLAVSMKEMKDTKRACIALAEFSSTYAAEAAGRLKSTYDTTRNGLTCGS